MTRKYQQFIFQSYNFDASTKTLSLHYGLDGVLAFTEVYHFNFGYTDYDQPCLDRALQTLFLLAGVSYYKTYTPPQIVMLSTQISATDAAFYSKTYQRGLGEFWYVNQLDPRTPVTFPMMQPQDGQALQHVGKGLLIGLGGGKDSLVTLELLQSLSTTASLPLATWSLGHHNQLQPLINRIGLPHYEVERQWDRQLLELNTQDALNGHIPISAIFAAVGTIVAVLTGKRDVVVSNEYAANEPTLRYDGVEINHQYSKSQEFETDYQALLRRQYGNTLRYYSFLRPLSELHIAELFAGSGFLKYHDVFSSCNRAYIHSSNRMFWCGQCPKCAFIFMILTPFVPRTALEVLWSGRTGGPNLLLDEGLQPLYRQLLGIEGNKPLECIGEIKESRAAMRLCQTTYPMLKQLYEFELPEDYDYKQMMSDEMPTEIKQLFYQALAKIQ